MDIQKHFELLGQRVRDRVTKMEGIVTSLSFDLYGCIQAIVHPGLEKESQKFADQAWFDVRRLEVVDKEPVMERPEYNFTPEAISAGLKGPAEKPLFNKA